MDVSTREPIKKAKRMAMENTYGAMDPTMRGSGKTIKSVERAFILGLMGG